MPEKSVREMGALERRHYSLGARVWRSLIAMSAILAVISIFVGLSAHAYAVLNQNLAVAYHYASSAADLLESEVDVVGLSEDFMAHFASLSQEERSKSGTQEYEASFIDGPHADDYRRALTLLQGLENNENVEYIYLGMYDTASQSIVYIVDPDPAAPYPAGAFEQATEREMEVFLDPSNTGIVSYIDWTAAYGWMGTSACAIKNAQGDIVALVFADVSMPTVIKSLGAYALQYSLVMFVAINVLALIITRHLRKKLVDPINEIAGAAESYAEDRAAGDTATNHFSKLEIKTGDEIENLALVMADMEHGLSEYEDNLTRVTAEKQRISTELNLATAIQSGMLPNIFPPFPDRGEFDIYAVMDPAKEVGGDFYDFFMIDENHLAMIIADVSGKGIPAALFMMMTKILLSDHASMSTSPAEILSTVNATVCANNSIDMFITVWIGILDVRTGTVIAANAGHEYPAVRNSSGRFSLLKDRHGFVIGGMPGSEYHDYQIQLEPGDCIFVYTDGVTEATNDTNELYGTDRLIEALNSCHDGTSDDIIDEVLVDIDRFVGQSPQFDDLTMLCMRYRGIQKRPEETGQMAEITVPATIDNIPAVTTFVNEHLERLDCPIKAQAQIDIAIDELFGNIAQYAYASGTGEATVRFDVEEDPRSAVITFVDSGVPFNPLAMDDPDVTLSAEERKIGGLGVFLVKQTMDDINYEYRDGQNILRIKKVI